VITSATKGLRESVYQAIEAMYNDAFPAGESWLLAADRDGVGLPMATSKFATFAQADYDAIFAKLVSGEVIPLKDTDAASADALPVENVKVTVVQ
jgi:basic membrane protein A